MAKTKTLLERGAPHQPRATRKGLRNPRDYDRGLLVFVVAAAAYSLFFYAWPLPELSQRVGHDWLRYKFFDFLLVPEVLAGAWFGPPGENGILDRLPIAGTAAAIVMAGWAVGALVLRALSADRDLLRLERFVFQTAIGLNLVSLYTLAVGLAGYLQHRAGFTVPGVAVITAAVAWMAWSARRSITKRPRAEATPIWRSGWFWLCLPLVAFILFGGVLPPIEFDVREYHLQAPKEFFRNGRIGFLPHNVYGNMPLGSEMHSLLGMVLLKDWWRGALVGKTVEALFAPLTALALAAAGRRWFTTSCGTLAALVYLSIPWIAQVSMLGLVEGALGFYLFVTVYALLLWYDERETVWYGQLVVAGFTAGSAVTVKYTAAVFVLLPAATFVAISIFVRGNAAGRVWTRLLKQVAVFLLAALVACGPWLVKNAVLTGNPVYPLLYRVFDGQTRTATGDAQWRQAHSPPNFHARELGRSVRAALLSSEWLSPVVWPLAAVAVLGTGDRRLRALLVYFCYVFAGWWLLTHRIDRFWVPALPLVCLLAGGSLVWARTRPRQVAIAAFVLAGVVYSAVVIGSGAVGYNRFFVRLDDLRSDPERVSIGHRWLNEHVPRGDTVLAVGDAQVFDLEMPVLYNTVFDASIFEERVRAGGGQLLPKAEIRSRLANVAFIYVDWAEIDRYRSPGNYGFSEFIQPKVFAELVAGGVLNPAIELADGRVQVFPVVK